MINLINIPSLEEKQRRMKTAEYLNDAFIYGKIARRPEVDMLI